MKIIDIHEAVTDGPQRTRVHSPTHILIHRIGKSPTVDLGNTGIEIAAHFSGRDTTYPEVARATGGQQAYTMVVGVDAWRLLPDNQIGWHAGQSWSRRAIGVAVIGDFRNRAPYASVWLRTLKIVASLCSTHNIPSAHVMGHDEAPGGSNDPRKQCPGDLWPMRIFRAELAEMNGSCPQV